MSKKFNLKSVVKVRSFDEVEKIAKDKIEKKEASENSEASQVVVSSQYEDQKNSSTSLPDQKENAANEVLGASQRSSFDQPTTNLQNQPTTRLQPTYNQPTEEAPYQPTTRLQPTYNQPTQQPTTRLQTSLQNQPTTNLQKRAYQTLSGNNKKVLDDILFLCASSGSLITPPMRPKETALRVFGEPTKTNIKNVTMCWYRLQVGMGLIRRHESGHGGLFSRFEVSQPLFFEYKTYEQGLATNLQNQPTTNLQEFLHQPTNQPTQQPTSALERKKEELYNSIFLSEELKASGVNLEMFIDYKMGLTDLQDFLDHLTSAIKHKELRAPLISFVKSDKQKNKTQNEFFNDHLLDERKAEIKKIADQKKLNEELKAQKLELSFDEHLEKNPSLLLAEIEKQKSTLQGSSVSLSQEVITAMARAELKKTFVAP